MEEFSDQMPSDIQRFPMVPIRDVVIFPFTKVAFKIGRPSSVRALDASLRGISAAQIADSMCSHLRITVEEKQDLLETVSVQERLQKLVDVLEAEIEKRQLDRSIHSRTKKQMDKHQREYYLNEQIKAIHKELGRKDEKAELDELRAKIENAGMTDDAKDKSIDEFFHLQCMPQ